MKISVPKSAIVVAASVFALTGMSMAAAQQIRVNVETGLSKTSRVFAQC